MSNRAWVTLATNDSYGLGALVLAHSLRKVGSPHPAVVLITPSVTDAMQQRLSAVFAEVITVNVLDSGDAAHLALLQRPELGITFTKIHCWNLTQYEKCVFLDADALVVQNCDELFEREELSAAPDVGWPDCFNSGVFVFKPSKETFESLIKFAQERGSFDGGDQGLLNSFFSDWAQGDINKHLPFLYNVTSAAFYSYLPALKHYGQNLKIIHFIGATKPWLQQYNWESRSVDAPDHISGFLQLWWNIFVSNVHAQLDTTMTGVAGNLARVVPGSSSAREAVDELTRRQGWEAGNIDYMGADSFDNIWAKISQTLNQSRASPPKSSPKEPSPPPKQPSPPKEVTPPEEPQPDIQAVQESVETPVAPEKVDVAKEATEITKEEESSSAAVSEEIDIPKATSVSGTELPKKAGGEGPEAEIPLPKDAKEETVQKTEKPSVPSTPPTTPKSTPEPGTPVAETAPQIEEKKSISESPAVHISAPTPVSSAPASEPSTPSTPVKPAPIPATTTPEKPVDAAVATDSPPLANTPSKETPVIPDAKSVEKKKPGKLTLGVATVADPSPTPDSELEDAAALAHAIIADELAAPCGATAPSETPAATVTSTPTVTPAPPQPPSSPPQPTQEKNLAVQKPEVPTPPVGAVSLAQIGVKSKEKETTAAQIESSLAKTEPSTPTPPSTPSTEGPKKKVAKKSAKKEGQSAETPVPPPRKKEKKPKDK